MNKAYILPLLACLAFAAGCGRDETAVQASRDGEAADAAAGRVLGKVATRVRTRLENGNITLHASDGRGRAEITPQGDLIVEGGKMAIDDAQRQLLLRYRAGIIAVAVAGADIGMQGADFGLRAAGKALRGAFSGDGDQVEREIEADAREFEARARGICEHLPSLLDAQERLAARLPEFAPYAKMDPSDIDDCRHGD